MSPLSKRREQAVFELIAILRKDYQWHLAWGLDVSPVVAAARVADEHGFNRVDVVKLLGLVERGFGERSR